VCHAGARFRLEIARVDVPAERRRVDAELGRGFLDVQQLLIVRLLEH
jgi:hypothetical protein